MKIFKEKASIITWIIKDEDLNKSETLRFSHSQHSFKRANQRNISSRNISEVIEYGKAFFKQGLVFYVLGEHNLPKSLNQNDKSKNIVVIIAGDSNTILTCYRSKNPYKHIKKKQKTLVKQYVNAS